MSFRVNELKYSVVVGVSPIYKAGGYTSYMRGVFILCWHHKDNKLLSIYRNIKSQDGLDL